MVSEMIDKKNLYDIYQQQEEIMNFFRIRRIYVASRYAKKGLILDLGCHDTLLRSFLPLDCFYVGADISHSALRKGSGHRVQIDAEQLPFRNNVFDQVFCLEVLEHLPSPINCIYEIRRVLKHNGKLVITTPNKDGVFRRIKRVFKRKMKKSKHEVFHLHKFTYEILENMLKEAGFITIREKISIAYLPKLRHLPHAEFLTIILGKMLPTTWQNLIMLRCRKK